MLFDGFSNLGDQRTKEINSQSSEDTQVKYISKNTLSLWCWEVGVIHNWVHFLHFSLNSKVWATDLPKDMGMCQRHLRVQKGVVCDIIKFLTIARTFKVPPTKEVKRNTQWLTCLKMHSFVLDAWALQKQIYESLLYNLQNPSIMPSSTIWLLKVFNISHLFY